jgi:N-carbamoyl-L-amino-acid hydrolase
MDRRRDALLGSARMIEAVNKIALSQKRGRATVGELGVSPNSRNTVPGQVLFTVDIRDPDAGVMQEMENTLHTHCQDVASGAGLDLKIDKVAYTPPVDFDSSCIELVRGSCEKLHYSHRDMLSGAGHDACYIARVAPTSMIFVPCAGGISHNEEESAEPDDLAAGCNTLLHAVLARAN